MAKAREHSRTGLPQWARDEIGRLERSVEWWKGKATAGPDNSDTFVVELTADEDRPLGTQPTIRFGKTDDRRLYIEATLRDDGSVDLRVPDGALAVYPRNSNSARVIGHNWGQAP